MKRVRLYLAATILHTLLFSLLYIFIPELRFAFVEENQFLENLTAIYYFDSFLLGLILWLRSPAKKRNLFLLAIPILGLVCFLDELSFIEQILGAKTPFIMGFKIDALHDFIHLGRRIIFYEAVPKFNALSGSIKFLVAVCVLSVISLVLLKLSKKKHLFYDKLISLKNHSTFWFLQFFVGYILISQAIDLHSFVGLESEFLPLIEELSEMSAALTLLFASLAISENKDSIPSKFSLQSSLFLPIEPAIKKH